MSDGAVDFVVEVGECSIALGVGQGVIVPIGGGIERPDTIGMRLGGMRVGLGERYSQGLLQRLVSDMPEPSILGDENSGQQETQKPPDGRDHNSESLFRSPRTYY
jgi:hypothetical protein